MKTPTDLFYVIQSNIGSQQSCVEGEVVRDSSVGEAVDLEFGIHPCVPSPSLSSSAESRSAVLLYRETVKKVLSIRLSEIPQDTNAASSKKKLQLFKNKIV